MSDYGPDTPVMTTNWCPACEPTRDPITELLQVDWCGSHREAPGGSEDAVVNSNGSYLSGSAEAGGEDNRRWCAVIHRAAPRSA